MNTKQKLISILGTAITAALLAAPAVSAVIGALGLGTELAAAYGCAGAGVLICALIAFSMKTAIPAAILAVLGAGGYIALNLSSGSIAALVEGISLMRAGEGILALAPAAGLITGAGALVLAILFYILISDRGGFTITVAVALSLGMSVVSAAVGNAIDIWQLAPSALGACLAFAHTAEQRMTGGHIKAIFPAALAVILAIVAIPMPGTTWSPLEEAANTVKQLYEDYFSYTQERVAFSISERGYNYYGLKNNEPTHMLGGPADPDKGEVMRVETDDDLLLRGTARSTYTGYSWEDYAAKSRNLYYDFTRRARRSAVFGLDILESIDAEAGFDLVEGRITLLTEGSSTLFAPARLTSLDMDLKNALYYNSVGELFLARNVEAGDEYAFTAMEPISPAAIAALAAQADISADKGYADAAADYLQLPEGIEGGVYQLAELFTQGAGTDAEKAQAILEGIQANCIYKLEVDYPPQDRDFVSWFLLDSKEGYCSYFATAMAVMCRMQGIPARYVEGYRVYAEPDGDVTVTGEEAHAWVEVYIRGLGWVAYDPTPGYESELQPPEQPDVTPSPSPTPTPTPTPPPMDDPAATPTPEPDANEPTPSPTPEPESEPTSTPEPTPEPDVPPENDDTGGKWKWIVLIVIMILLIVLMLWTLLKKRLRDTDPIHMIARQKNDNRSVLILYRAMLTLLAQLGHMPQSGETPEAFAARVCRSGLANSDFEEFARGVILTRYSRTPASRELVSLGSRAYLVFRQHMKRSERLRFDLRRAMRGIGDVEQIP